MAKNTHLTHIEDRIITDGASGAKEAIEMLKYMGDFLSGKPGGRPLVTEKWDGAPAVICGTNPENGQFFVGTKSVFAKTAPKICYSYEDIDRFYSGVLAEKLKACFTYLNGKVKGVLQGDLMFTNDKKQESIDGKQYVTFRPNTLTYAAPIDSDVGKQIQQAKLGIVFHTKYSGRTMQGMTAGFNVSDADFQKDQNVWIQKATYQDISGAANMSNPERIQYDNAVRKAEGSCKAASSLLNKIQTGKKTLEIDTELLKFFNNYVKKGQNIPSVKQAFKDFQGHLSAEVDKMIQKRVTSQAQEKLAAKLIGMLDFIESNKAQFDLIIAAYMNIQYCKNILVRQLQKVQALRVFANMGDKYVVTAPEGYVAVEGQRAVKLIDRLEFSKLNFTIPKQWDK
jgi:hypothetical protein